MSRIFLSHRTKVAFGILVLLLSAGVGWWKQGWLKEQYQWRWVMGASVLTPDAEHALKAGDEFPECKKGCPTMVVIPAGKFIMGSPESEKGRIENEGPQHDVTFAKPFAVGKFDVTFAEWDVCVEAGACPHTSVPASDNGRGREDRPVIDVSWHDAELYVAWLSRLTGKEYQLLSEAEWEYAARAGATTAYYWGDDIGQGNANCDGCGSQWDEKQTAPVGSFKPNAFGLYDMAGNVLQWVEDCYHDSYEEAPNDGSAWVSGGDCGGRVLRGGSWDLNSRLLRAASRVRYIAVFRLSNVGFRLGRTITP